MAAATRNTNTDRNDSEYLAAKTALAQKLLAKRESYAREANLSQSLADRVAKAGIGFGVVAGAAPAMRDNFSVAYSAQRELQARKTATYALQMADKVLQA